MFCVNAYGFLCCQGGIQRDIDVDSLCSYHSSKPQISEGNLNARDAL